jgi:hypothetical protein
LSTQSSLGDIVSGTLIKFPDNDVTYIVGEIFINGDCNLYALETNTYKGLYAISEIKAYVR